MQGLWFGNDISYAYICIQALLVCTLWQCDLLPIDNSRPHMRPQNKWSNYFWLSIMKPVIKKSDNNAIGCIIFGLHSISNFVTCFIFLPSEPGGVSPSFYTTQVGWVPCWWDHIPSKSTMPSNAVITGSIHRHTHNSHHIAHCGVFFI